MNITRFRIPPGRRQASWLFYKCGWWFELGTTKNKPSWRSGFRALLWMFSRLKKSKANWNMQKFSPQQWSKIRSRRCHWTRFWGPLIWLVSSGWQFAFFKRKFNLLMCAFFYQRVKMIENVLQFSQCQLVFSVFTRTSSLSFFSSWAILSLCSRKKESDQNQKRT